MKDYINVPMDRKGAIIGKNRATLNEIERITKTKISIEGNNVEIDGESLDIMDAKNIIIAVARGFNPKNAMKLLEENITIEILDLTVFDKPIINLRARLIGTEGKVRKEIERLTGTSISVYGKTVSIIGTFEQVKAASDAVNMLISGARHASVYKHIQDLQGD